MHLRDSKPPPPTPDSDSLVRRLAGPSTTKAGLAKDQREINRIIAEASKGSKFYENEKRKDKDLTERIDRILKHRDEVMKGVDLNEVEQGVDKLLAQLEAQRDLSQLIVHVDMDAFYASVELLDNADLASKPFGVGRGVLTTASYEARKFGVRSGMPAFIAKKLCPNLTVISNRFHRYSEMSHKVMAIFRRYDPNMSVMSCDEGYLNITDYCRKHSLTPEECVSEMRRVVQEETNLTASAGIAPNRMLAKVNIDTMTICSDRNKPDGQFKLDFDAGTIKTFMHDLSIRKLPGVGRVNERLLESIGIKTCGDIFTQRAVLSLMDKQFGLVFLLQAYLGIASNVVEPWQREEKKSIGAERTFSPISDIGKIYSKLEEVARELSDDMTEGGWTGKTVTLKYKLDTYQVYTRAKSLDKWVSRRQEDLFAIGKELLKPELPLTIRLIGLRVRKLKDLKAEAESKARGIKRFFNATPSSVSPSKKRRTEAFSVEENEDELPQLSQDGFATSMPGYLDEVEPDHIADEDYVDADVDADANVDDNPSSLKVSAEQKQASSSSAVPPGWTTASRKRPPVSAPARGNASTLLSKPLSSVSASVKPASTSSCRNTGTKQPGTESSSASYFECPICGKMLETDNQGVNEHVDFCLSKQAIKEAQAASLQPAGNGGPSTSTVLRRGHKPGSGPEKNRAGDRSEGLLRFRKKE